MKRFLPIVLLLLTFLPQVWAQEENLVSFTITGTVRNDSDELMAGMVIEFNYEETTVGETGIYQTKTRSFTATTDLEGKYLFQLNLNPTWENFRMLAVSSANDSYRYLLPKEKQLSEIIANSVSNGQFKIQINWVIVSKPLWEEQANLLQQYGPESDKGRLVRLRGIPSRIMKFSRSADNSGEIWFYYKDGIAVRFINGVREKDFYFKPR